MQLQNSVLKRHGDFPQQSCGFTLIELIIAALLGSLLALVASQLFIRNMRIGAIFEGGQRVREHWGRTVHFIESEVALSERVITNPSMINLGQCAAIISTNDFRFALEIRRDIPPVIYYITDNTQDSLELAGDKSLYRCGPSIDRNGNYSGTISSSNYLQIETSLLADGMTAECQIDASTIRPQPNLGSGKSLGFEFCLQGLTSNRYSQTVNTYSRVSPIFSYPSTTTLCNGLSIEGFQQLEGSSSNGELLEVPQSALKDTDAILICGNGGGDTIKGSSADDILEAGNSGSSPEPGALIQGNSGSDHLRGGPGNDTLIGGDGDDVLIGQPGNDYLIGGNGDNQYLPGEGHSTVEGGGGIDVIFVNKSKANVENIESCKRTQSCTLAFTENGTDSSIELEGIEVLIFQDGRHDITN